MEYIISDCDDDESSNNENKEPTKVIRYPGDIKTKSVEVDVLKRALQKKDNQIQKLKAEVQRLKKHHDTYEYKLDMVFKVLDSLVNKKYIGSEMVNLIKVSFTLKRRIQFLYAEEECSLFITSYIESINDLDSTVIVSL